MKKVFIFTSVHQWNDTRIFHKQVKSLSKNYLTEYHAPAEFKYKIIENISIIGLPMWNTIYDRFKINFELYKRVLSSNADIYHFHDLELVPIGLIIKLFKNKPVIFDIHENFIDQIKYKSKIPSVFKSIFLFILKFVNKYILSFFFIIFAENSYVKLYPKLKKNKYEVILNLPILKIFDKYNLITRKKKYDLFYIGAITPERGYAEMIQALDILHKKNLKLKLHLIGPNWYKLGLSENYKYLEKYVIFYGRLDIKDGYKYSKNARIGLSILHPIDNYINSYPTKIFEYMACSLPVITSDFDLYKSIVEDNQCGICINPRDPNQLANAIEKIFSNPILVDQYGKNGRKLVKKKYNWSIEENKLLKFYKSIL